MPDYSGETSYDTGALGTQSASSAEAAPAALTSGKEPPKISDKEAKLLKQRMVRSEQYMIRKFKDPYERCMKLWRGHHWKEQRLPSIDHRVVVNYILPNIQTKVASIGFNYPDFVLRPLNQKSQQNLDVAHDALTYEWRIAEAQREVKRALFDKELLGIGIVQCGWDFTTDEISLEDQRQPVEGEPLDPNTVMDQIEKGQEIAPPVPLAKVRKDQFSVRRINPRDFRIDPESTWVLEHAMYCGYVENRPLADIKADKRLKNTKQLKGNSKNLETYLDEETLSLPDEQIPTDVKRVKLHHYYERKRRLHCIFCDEHDKPLLVEEWLWEWDEYPFVALHAAVTQDEWYPETPGPILLEPMQREINETRSQIHIHRSRYNRKYQCRRGTLDAQAKKQLRSPADGTVVEHQGAELQAIVPISDAPLQEEVYRADQIAKQDIITISAVDQYDLGMVPTKRMTEGEVNAARGSGGARVMSDAQAFEQFCAKVAHQCLNWLMQFSVKTRSLPIYDPTTEDISGWTDYTAEDIQGDYLVEVYVGSTQIPNTQETVKDIGFLLQSLMPAIQANMINPRPLFEQLLKSFPFIRNVKEIVGTPQMPMTTPGGPPGVPGPPTPGAVPGSPQGGAGAGPGVPPLPGPAAGDPHLALAQAMAGGAPPPPGLLAALTNGR